MLFLRFAMLLDWIHNLKFLRIQMAKGLEIKHGGLYRLQVMHFFLSN